MNTATSPNVQYAFDETVDAAGELSKGLRPTSVTYPNGRVLRYEYSSGDDDNLGRISYLADDDNGEVGTHLAEYGRLGLGQIVKVDYTEPDLRLDLLSGGGLDSFDRVKDLRWVDYQPNPDVDVVQIKHGYDRMSNRLYREDVVAATNGQDLDEFYTYDGVNQLKTFQRGNLTGSPPTGLSSKNFAQRWCFDATGNWVDFDQDDDGDNTWDLQQARTHNTANEITAITAGWVDPVHDRAGNMTTIPQPNSPSESYTLTFDAWNRLVRVEDGEHLVAEYEYDGLMRRTLKRVWPGPGEGPSGADSSSSSSSSSGGDTFETQHFYYSNEWQVLEERIDDSEDADRQYIWGLRYIDDLVLRDRDTESGGALGFSGSGLDERLYALQDANWNVVAIADENGTIQERYIYAAYGQPTVLNADFTEKQSGTAYDWHYLYTGRRLDDETSLYYYRTRYYSAELGRFVGRDLIEYTAEDFNLYRYVGNMPTLHTDPDGMQSSPIFPEQFAPIDYWAPYNGPYYPPPSPEPPTCEYSTVEGRNPYWKVEMVPCEWVYSMLPSYSPAAHGWKLKCDPSKSLGPETRGWACKCTWSSAQICRKVCGECETIVLRERASGVETQGMVNLVDAGWTCTCPRPGSKAASVCTGTATTEVFLKQVK